MEREEERQRHREMAAEQVSIVSWWMMDTFRMLLPEDPQSLTFSVAQYVVIVAAMGKVSHFSIFKI